jgi:hypothetical protein
METSTETTFVALYQGKTINEAKILAVSADPTYVSRFCDMLPGGAIEKPLRRPTLRLVPEPDHDPAA